MAEESTPRSPGWYADPETGEDRYWDGEAWGAYWTDRGDDSADAERGHSEPPIVGSIGEAVGGREFVFYLVCAGVPVVGLVATLILWGYERHRQAAIALGATAVGAVIYVGPILGLF